MVHLLIENPLNWMLLALALVAIASIVHALILHAWCKIMPKEPQGILSTWSTGRRPSS